MRFLCYLLGTQLAFIGGVISGYWRSWVGFVVACVGYVFVLGYGYYCARMGEWC